MPYLTNSYLDYRDLQAEADAFEGLAAHALVRGILSKDGKSELVMGEVVTGNYFDVLGVQPRLGRAFLAEPEGAFAPLLLGLAPAADGGLDVAALANRLAALDRRTLARLHPSAEPAKVLLDALREVLFFWLFLAGARVGREVDESLGRAVRAKLAQLEGLA